MTDPLDFVDALASILLFISNLLLVPDILLLLVLFIATMLHLGGFIFEAVVRRRRRSVLDDFLVELKAARDRPVRAEDVPAAFGLPALAMSELAAVPQAADKILNDLELYAERLLARLVLGVRLGPILGLAGTLIPLGPALVALSQGDLETLSSRLVVAFTTTVLGLFIGGTCFAMHTVRRGWYMQDLDDVSFIAERMK